MYSFILYISRLAFISINKIKTRNEILIENGVIYYQNRIVIPNISRKITSTNADHNEIIKTYLRDKQLVYWPRLKSEVKQYVLNCKTCDRFKNANLTFYRSRGIFSHLVARGKNFPKRMYFFGQLSLFI